MAPRLTVTYDQVTTQILYVGQHVNLGGPVSGNETIYWDAVRQRLGIGTNTPGSVLEVDGTLTVNSLIAGPNDGTRSCTINLAAGNSSAGQVVFTFQDASFFFAGVYSIFGTNDVFYQIAPFNAAGWCVLEGSNQSGTAPFGIGTNNNQPLVFYVARGLYASAPSAEVARFDTDLTFKLSGNDSANSIQYIAQFAQSFISNTHASWTGRLQISAADFNSFREGMRIEGNGSAALIGFFGATAVVKQSGGALAAGATYTANEQSMLNKAYTALRNYGLLT